MVRLKAWLLVAGLACAVPAHAATTYFGINGGLALPVGDFGDAANTGFTLGASLDIPVNDMWWLGGEVGWAGFGGSDDLEDALSILAGEDVDVSFRAIPIIATARLMIPTQGTVAPFVRGGLGAYMFTAELEGETFEDDDSETDLGFNLGGGFLARTGGSMMWGADLIYHYIATEDESTNVLTVRGLLLFGTGGP
jgi:opacity protein-like surface antigen